MPPIVPIVVVIFITSLMISVIWVSLQPEGTPQAPAPKEDGDESLLARTQEERDSRRAAQDRLFGELDRVRSAREARRTLNSRPYDTDNLPDGTLTLIRMVRVVDDQHAAFVLLLPGAIASVVLADFDSYWSQAESAIWAWQGDNLLDEFREGDLKREADARLARMRGALGASGWRVDSTQQVSEQVIVLTLSHH